MGASEIAGQVRGDHLTPIVIRHFVARFSAQCGIGDEDVDSAQLRVDRIEHRRNAVAGGKVSGQARHAARGVWRVRERIVQFRPMPSASEHLRPRCHELMHRRTADTSGASVSSTRLPFSEVASMVIYHSQVRMTRPLAGA